MISYFFGVLEMIGPQDAVPEQIIALKLLAQLF
jgi:hypothetical protein